MILNHRIVVWWFLVLFSSVATFLCMALWMTWPKPAKAADLQYRNLPTETDLKARERLSVMEEWKKMATEGQTLQNIKIDALQTQMSNLRVDMTGKFASIETQMENLVWWMRLISGTLLLLVLNTFYRVMRETVNDKRSGKKF